MKRRRLESLCFIAALTFLNTDMRSTVGFCQELKLIFEDTYYFVINYHIVRVLNRFIKCGKLMLKISGFGSPR